jgi:hypothetical protein
MPILAAGGANERSRPARIQRLDAASAAAGARSIIVIRGGTHMHQRKRTRGQRPSGGAPNDNREPVSPQDPAQRRSAQGTLSSGHSSGSSSGGTAGGVLTPRGSGHSPREDWRVGGAPNDGALAREGVAAGAAGFRNDTAYGRLKPGASGAEEEEMGTDGGAAVTGVAGVSGGGRGTTSSTNTRR